MKKKIALMGLIGLATAVSGYGAVNAYFKAASSIKMTVTGMYLGNYNGTICAGWKTVFENANATGQDFTQSLNIGNGSVDLGSYNCLALMKIPADHSIQRTDLERCCSP
jgi:hypothetical protein